MANSSPEARAEHRVVRLLLRSCGVLFVVSLTLVLLDVLVDVRLPGPLRATLPWLLLASMLVGTTLLVGLLGMPGRPDRNGAGADIDPG